jgi:hypothetical protein
MQGVCIECARPATSEKLTSGNLWLRERGRCALMHTIFTHSGGWGEFREGHRF